MAKGVKTGGRKPGTPNNLSSELKGKIGRLLQNYMGNGEDISTGRMWEDMEQMTPGERANFAKGLLGYIVPKQTEEKINLNSENKTLEGILMGLAEE